MMFNLIHSFHEATKRYLVLVKNKDSLSNVRVIIISLVILSVWLTGVIFISTTHEFSRDEVRALTLVRAATSPLQLFELIQFDGHPILWYLILYFGCLVTDSPVVLPVVSIVISLTAVTIFIFFSPFPLWLKMIFIFSVLPFYEYSVMARNYGISMLLFFVFASLYRKKTKFPLLLALVLFLLVNTNIHSAILGCLIAAVWTWDTLFEQKIQAFKLLGHKFSNGKIYISSMIVAMGLILCLYTTWPKDNTILTNIHIGSSDIVESFIKASVSPSESFSGIIPNFQGPADDLLVYIVILGLFCRINFFLAAISGQVILGMFFYLYYGAGLRHQGIFLIFLISLYWMVLETHSPEATNLIIKILFKVGLYVALLILLFFGLYKSKNHIIADIRWEKSSSKAFGSFINKSNIYSRAIIVPEPDYLVESLPYYTINDIYLPREHLFSKTVSWTTDSNNYLSLGDLLCAAHWVRRNYGRPVLIVLGHWDMDESKANRRSYSYNKIFFWDAKDLSELNRTTKLVAIFKAALTDENYMVYAIE